MNVKISAHMALVTHAIAITKSLAIANRNFEIAVKSQ